MLDPASREVVRQGARGAVEGVLKPIHDLILELCGPAVDELGTAWKTELRVWRLQRAVRHAQRVRELLEPLGIERRTVSLRFVLRSIEEASVEENDDLQDRWAALIANAADPQAPTPHPAFISILRDLSASEARLVDRLYAMANVEPASDEAPISVPVTDSDRLVIRPQVLRVSMPHVGQAFLDARLDLLDWEKVYTLKELPQRAALGALSNGGLALQNLARLQVIEKPLPSGDIELTELGRRFVLACQRPDSASGSRPAPGRAASTSPDPPLAAVSQTPRDDEPPENSADSSPSATT